MRPDHHYPRFVVERRLERLPASAPKSIRTVWQKIAFASRLATAERCLINALQDGGEVRLRQVRQ